MIVLKVKKGVSISHRDSENKNRGISLYEGDLLLFNEKPVYIEDKFSKHLQKIYSKYYILESIYYKKIIDISGRYIWKLEEQNIIKTYLDGTYLILSCSSQGGYVYDRDSFEDVSIKWNRDKKIEELVKN